MKQGIVIFVVILILVGILWGLKIYQQQQVIKSIPNAELSETMDTQTEATQMTGEGFSVEITKTPTEIIQESFGSDVVVDPNNTFLTFSAYGPGKSHTGTFETLKARVNFDEVKTVTGGSLTIEAASVRTDAAGLDTHLQSEDFFDVETYPTVEYILNNVVFNSGSGAASAQGRLTFHGVTKDITTPVTILPNGFNTKFNLSLEDFGISYIGVNDAVTVEAQVVLQ